MQRESLIGGMDMGSCRQPKGPKSAKGLSPQRRPRNDGWRANITAPEREAIFFSGVTEM